MILINEARWLSATWYLARPRRIIVHLVVLRIKMRPLATIDILSTLFPTSLKGRRDQLEKQQICFTVVFTVSLTSRILQQKRNGFRVELK